MQWRAVGKGRMPSPTRSKTIYGSRESYRYLCRKEVTSIIQGKGDLPIGKNSRKNRFFRGKRGKGSSAILSTLRLRIVPVQWS